MHEDSEVFAGLNTSKQKISVAVGDAGRSGEVRFFGDIDSAPTMVERIVRKRRFENPRQLMAYLGLVPSENSIGERVQRGRIITKSGNSRARRVLIERAWAYRFPARITATLQQRLNGLPKSIRDIASKAQVRLCGRYRRLMAKGKKRTVVVAAIAAELSAFF